MADIKLVVKIPKGFAVDVNDKFQDFFNRLKEEIRGHLRWHTSLLCGAYELETIEMFLNAFANATPLPKEHGIEQEPCEDCISRQAVLDGLASIAKAKAKSDAQMSLMGRVMFFVEKLPSVTPQTKVGHWITNSNFPDKLICSCCNTKFDMWFWEQKNLHYCPNCGTKIQEVKADEISG